jgi:hypothetical protein
MKTTTIKKGVAAGALVLSGLAIGGMAAGSLSASAATSTATSTVAGTAQSLDPTKSIRPDEHLLTGSTASKVRAAAMATYPNATIQRVETDSDGVYEAHIVTAAGDQVIVQVGKDFAVTGTQTGGGPGGGGPAPGTTAG